MSTTCRAGCRKGKQAPPWGSSQSSWADAEKQDRLASSVLRGRSEHRPRCWTFRLNPGRVLSTPRPLVTNLFLSVAFLAFRPLPWLVNLHCAAGFCRKAWKSPARDSQVGRESRRLYTGRVWLGRCLPAWDKFRNSFLVRREWVKRAAAGGAGTCFPEG